MSASVAGCDRLVRTQEECVPIHEGSFARNVKIALPHCSERGEQHGRRRERDQARAIGRRDRTEGA